MTMDGQVIGTPAYMSPEQAAGAGHWVTIRLIGGARSNRDAIGATLRVSAGGRMQTAEVRSGGSYLSQSDLRANFGLGQSKRAESVEIWWPSGAHQAFKNVDADRFYLIEEGKDALAQQRFGNRSLTRPTP